MMVEVKCKGQHFKNILKVTILLIKQKQKKENWSKNYKQKKLPTIRVKVNNYSKKKLTKITKINSK